MPWSFLNNEDQNQVLSELSEREDVGIIGFLRQSLLSPGAVNNDTCESRGKRQDHEFEKSRFRFDQKYPARVWIPFWIMIRFWISWKKKHARSVFRLKNPFLDFPRQTHPKIHFSISCHLSNSKTTVAMPLSIGYTLLLFHFISLINSTKLIYDEQNK